MPEEPCLVRVDSDGHDGEWLRMVACPIPGCGAVLGEDYSQYSTHLGSEHGPEDVGLSSRGRRAATGGGSADYTDAIKQTDEDPSDLRIKVGVHQDPTDALQKILGGSAEDKALRLHHDEGPTHVALRGSGLWGVAHVPGQDGLREGPMLRENLMSGLASTDRVEVVDRDAAPFKGRKRGGPNAE